MTEEGFWEEERVAFNGNAELKSFIPLPLLSKMFWFDTH